MPRGSQAAHQTCLRNQGHGAGTAVLCQAAVAFLILYSISTSLGTWSQQGRTPPPLMLAAFLACSSQTSWSVKHATVIYVRHLPPQPARDT